MMMLEWDQSTYMPPAAAEARGAQLSTLGKIVHQLSTDDRFGKWIEELTPYRESLPYDSDDAALIRHAKRDYERSSRVSEDYVSRSLKNASETYNAWVAARKADNFKLVESQLEKTLDLSREYASFFPYEHIADPLIDRSDFGMKATTIQSIFKELRDGLVPLVEEVTAQSPIDASSVLQHFPKNEQIQFGESVIKQLGFDFNRGRQDFAPHPFMIKFAHGDIRITTRVKEHDFTEAFFSTVHETGHALYELGIDPNYEGTPLHSGTSMSVHESQSRLWENIVGRSRGFWKHFYPQLQTAFPTQLSKTSLESFYRAVNRVERSLIRTDADELTYNLHVIIRFDLELAMLEGKLSVKDLPEAWRSRYQSDLGISSPTDKDGVLQDIHWYMDSIGGSFQGYALGNILSVQFFDAAVQAHPEIMAQIEKGEFSTLHSWLKQNIYQFGSKYTADEIIKKATGKEMTIAPYLNYLDQKYRDIYLTGK
ncbi:carboxypeptidase M32 [Hazenella sp. IB182353]|nr:carboxypeptidase M32 [Polycladospora coralii]